MKWDETGMGLEETMEIEKKQVEECVTSDDAEI